MNASRPTPVGNPAVVGLGGFGLTTLVLQFHNIGVMEMGPVIWLGLVFGGVAQFIAGLQERATGNNLGYCAFTAYGSFWISLVLMLMGNKLGFFSVTPHEIGMYLVAWTLFTAILWVAAMRVNGAMAALFSLLLFGFILLDVAHFVPPEQQKMWTMIAGYELILCALHAWYLMAHLIYKDIFSRDVLPAGPAWLRASP
jgi:uncharacterized protein